MYESILVAIDGSEDSSKAADWAIDIAKRGQATLYLITVVQSTIITNSSTGGGPPEPVDKARTAAEALVAKGVSKAEAKGVKVRGEIIENVPSVPDAILDYADEWKVQLIVVGTRGLSGLKRLILGSVSSEIVSKASCSVMVVR